MVHWIKAYLCSMLDMKTHLDRAFCLHSEFISSVSVHIFGKLTDTNETEPLEIVEAV